MGKNLRRPKGKKGAKGLGEDGLNNPGVTPGGGTLVKHRGEPVKRGKGGKA